jgi:hypothetical protein
MKKFFTVSWDVEIDWFPNAKIEYTVQITEWSKEAIANALLQDENLLPFFEWVRNITYWISNIQESIVQ